MLYLTTYLHFFYEYIVNKHTIVNNNDEFIQYLVLWGTRLFVGKRGPENSWSKTCGKFMEWTELTFFMYYTYNYILERENNDPSVESRHLVCSSRKKLKSILWVTHTT